ncbi:MULTISPECIES: hypothetical protein [Paraburkholderia]|uniref:hypothetical protein n=1 Tax=Paraburkholderia TaxID=1822464 RepID=UPI00225B9CAB|nr:MULTISPECIES: hypothetical protein [Paraburkholderia]MCX4164583.1 hypothetical protein [Paraburkholderia megapolitana]MDN7160076.1 hypothetical protein [Paraburkholderia sp. CHISQ3]MDQ6497123.1 hypothetical protein [Paraburkholderia megapolitana]
MGIWHAAPVESEPVAFLARWQVMETETGFRHFIGHNLKTGCGRVSTCIVKFDRETRRGVTQSGRIYELVAESGVDFNASTAWIIRCIESDMSSTDVSSEYAQPIIDLQRPAAPLIADLLYDGNPRRLIGKVQVTGQSFDAQYPEDLAELLFAKGVRHSYLRFPELDEIWSQPWFVDLARAVERRLNQLERGLPRDPDGPEGKE